MKWEFQMGIQIDLRLGPMIFTPTNMEDLIVTRLIFHLV